MPSVFQFYVHATSLSLFPCIHASVPYCIQLKRIRFSSINSVDYVDAVETTLKRSLSAKHFYIFLLKLLKRKQQLVSRQAKAK
jgi:hypothetical protein